MKRTAAVMLMLMPAMFWATASMAAAPAATSASPEQTRGTSIWGGLTVPTVLGDNYSTLQRSTGIQADLTFENPLFWRSIADVHVTGLFQPFKLRNAAVSDSNFDQMGAFAGLLLPAKTNLAGLELFFGGQIGLVYDWLKIPNFTTSNASTAFAVRLDQGFDLPIYGPVGLVADLPLTFSFSTQKISVLTASFLIRWKL